MQSATVEPKKTPTKKPYKDQTVVIQTWIFKIIGASKSDTNCPISKYPKLWWSSKRRSIFIALRKWFMNQIQRKIRKALGQGCSDLKMNLVQQHNWFFFTHGTRNCEPILQFSHLPRVASHWTHQVQRPEKTKHPTRRHLAEMTGRMVASWAHKENFRATRLLKTSLYIIWVVKTFSCLLWETSRKKSQTHTRLLTLVPIVGGRYNPNPWFFPGEKV